LFRRGRPIRSRGTAEGLGRIRETAEGLARSASILDRKRDAIAELALETAEGLDRSRDTAEVLARDRLDRKRDTVTELALETVARRNRGTARRYWGIIGILDPRGAPE
jgi:hypothetical protein